MRVPRSLPHDLTPELANDIIQTALSLRDKAILTLLYRTGQRIGDWNEGRGHGVLGMRLADLDARSATIVVRLKGARDEHRVPATEDFWALYHRYLDAEREAGGTQAAWIGLRRGRGKPLTYSAFESSLRHIGNKLGANVNAHMFRHTVARAVVETSGLKAAQELLGHAHVTTTADTYARVDHQAMLEAVINAKGFVTGCRSDDPDEDTPNAPGQSGYVFAYDRYTIDALEGAAKQIREGGGPTT
jgi:site-specific recombinase XerC